MKLIYFILLFQTATAFAFNGNSLTWQKLALEEKVQRKFNATLSGLLKDNQYLVEVETEISEPSAPNFGNSGHKSGPRVSDISMGESRGDYIAFSKMGLEVPVVEKFLDEDRTKLMNLYRFNETYDLFKNISDINVTVYLSDKIPQDLMEIVKKVLQGSKLAVAGIKPTIKYESIAMEWVDPAIKKAEEDRKKAEQKKEKPIETKKVQEEPKIWAKDWFEWASRWGNAFGLILGSIIIGYIALSLFKEWKAFMEKYAAQQQAAAQSEAQKDEEKDKDALAAALGQAESAKQEDDVSIAQGFERFQQCLEQHPDDAINMLRGWINDGEDNALRALRGVAQQASTEQMDKLMAGLNEFQRDKWKGLLGVHLEPAELSAANKFIFQEVVKSFLVPTRIKDSELLNLIMELNPKTTCEFMQQYEGHVGVLMNILSPGVIGKILALVNEKTADSWLFAGSEFPLTDMEEALPLLKKTLVAYHQANSPSPFAHRIMALIPTASPSREGSLFRALAKSGNNGMVLEVARKHFPSELIMELPSTFLKEVMQSYPISKRIEFLHSRPEGERTSLLDVLAETGTPVRDMLDMELENIGRDLSRGASIDSRSEEIWSDFVKNSRAILARQSAYTNFAEQLIKEWSQKLSSRLHSIKGGRAA